MTMNKNNLKRYIVVGACSYLIEMMALFSLRYGLKLSPIKAVAISFWVGLVVAFVLQKLITFKNYDKRAHIVIGQMAAYGLLVAWNYGFTLVGVKLLSRSVSVFIIRTTAILIITSWNFIVYSKLFTKNQEA